MIVTSVLARLIDSARKPLSFCVLTATTLLGVGSSVAAVPGVELISTTTIPGESQSTGPSRMIIATAANGRFVLFWSAATDLVLGGTNASDTSMSPTTAGS